MAKFLPNYGNMAAVFVRQDVLLAVVCLVAGLVGATGDTGVTGAPGPYIIGLLIWGIYSHITAIYIYDLTEKNSACAENLSGSQLSSTLVSSNSLKTE